MYTSFNIQELCDFLTYYFIRFSEEAAISFLNSINFFVFVLKTHLMTFEIET